EGEALLQPAAARGAALLGMELDSGERPVARCGHESFRCVHTGRGGGRIRVREPVCGPVGLDRRPPDPGYTSFADARGAAGHEAEPGDAAVLLALLEREVEAEADAERRPHA